VSLVVEGVVAAIFVAFGSAVGFGVAHHHYRPLLDKAEDKISAYTEDLKMVNGAVQTLKDAAAKRDRAAAADRKRAATLASELKAKALEVRNRPQPVGLDSCQAACQLLDTALGS
jgi:hypothetical protein